MVDQVVLLGRVAEDFVVNTVKAGDQADPSVTKLASGGFVVVWTDRSGQTDTSGFGVKAQIYDAQGAAVGGEILVNTVTDGAQERPTVGALANGGFVVGWGGYPVGHAQVFDAAGAKLGGEFVPFDNYYSDVSVAGLPGGGFVMTRGSGIGQLFDATGAKVGASFQIGSNPQQQGMTVAAALTGGGFVVASESFSGGAKIQLFNAAGVKVGAEIQTDNTASHNGQLSVAALSSGGFVLSWTNVFSGTNDGEGAGVKARIFDSAGAPVGPEFVVNTTAPGNESDASIIGLPGGGFFASWREESSSGLIASFVKGQVFDAAGTKVGSEFVISTRTDHPNIFQAQPAVALIAGDRLVVVWHGAGPGDARSPDWTINNIDGGIRAQIFEPLGSVALDIQPSKTVVSEIAMGNVASLSFSTASPAVNAIYSYSLLSESTGGGFILSGNRLVLADNGKLDFETAPLASVTVQVTDNAGNTVQEVIQLTIADAAPEPRYAALDEKVVNTQRSQGQFDAQIARISGGFVVVWTDESFLGDGTGSAIKAQRYDNFGNPAGAEFRVNTYGNAGQDAPAVTSLPNGGFAVAWSDRGGFGGDSDDGVSLQLFNAAGATVGSQILVNTATSGPQYSPSIASLAGGGMVVTWTSGYSGATETRAQIFDAAGAKVGGEIAVNTQVTGDQDQAVVTRLANGGFMVVWRDTSLQGGDASGSSIKAQLFDAAGAKVGGEVLVNTTTQSSQSVPAIATAPDGSILVAWQHPVFGSLGLKAQLFDANGAKSGTELTIDGLFNGPTIAPLPSGGWFMAASGSAGGLDPSAGLVGQILTANGAKVGDSFLVNQVVQGDQFGAAATILPNGTIATAWTDRANGFGIEDVKLRLFVSTDIPVARNDAVTTNEATALAGNLFANNGFGADSGGALEIVAINGNEAAVGQQIVLASGAKLTVAADGTFSYDPADAYNALVAPGSGAANTQAAETFTYSLAGGSIATVTVTVSGVTSPGDRYAGTANADSIVTTQNADTILIHQGGTDSVQALGGDDTIFVGFRYDEATAIDGGEGNDALFLQSYGPHTLTAANLKGIESVVLMSAGDNRFGTAFATSVNYDLTIPDAALGAGRTLVIDGSGLLEVGGYPESLRLDARLETDARFVVSGGVGYDVIVTGARNDELVGNIGHDYLDGGAGADLMRGGPGDDTFFVDNAGDVVVENAGEGTDHVQTSLSSYTMTANVENIVGTSALGQALTGNALANIMSGGDGNDVLDGGAGADNMTGGTGNDVYVFDDAGDRFYEAPNQGTDEIRTSLSNFSIQDRFSIENLTGTAATGQTLVGNTGANVITGGAGNDFIDGAEGDDVLRGGAGDDVYYLVREGDTIIENAGEGTDEIRTDLSVFSLAAFANVEVLTGILNNYGQTLAGNALANRITGSNGNDIIDGGAGADVLRGGAGNDIYYVDESGDVIEDGEFGKDEVRSTAASYALGFGIAKLTGLLGTGQALIGNSRGNTILAGSGNDAVNGGAGDDALNGGAGDDYLDGGADNDTMGGSTGNDVYIVDSAFDKVVEAAGEGMDEIRTALASYSLAALTNVENLTGTSATGQTLTGNGLDNVIFAGMGDDLLEGGAGDDVLIGYGGSDVMKGGAGNDVYIIDAADTVVEFAGDGLDEVRTQAEIFVLSDALENLRATSDIGHDFRGNAGNNVIIGGDGNDIVRAQDGGGDLLFGKAGVDSFYMGGSFDNGDFIDGGDNRDSLILQGNYNLTFTWNITGGSSLANIEGISLLPGNVTQYGDVAGNFYSYNLTLVDGNVAAGQILKINGVNLRAGENFTLDASAGLDGVLQVFGGFGVDTFKGGQQGDSFIFAHDGRFGAGDSVDGGGGYDLFYLRGDYVIDFNAAGFAGSLKNVESIALLTSANTEFAGGGDGDFDYDLTWNDSMLAAGATLTVNGSRLQSFETFVFHGGSETNGQLRLFGGAGADTLETGGGNDQLHGGGGADALTGGAGADLYRYSLTSDSTLDAHDTVFGFEHGVDKIDVNRVDAKASTLDDNEAFAFIGSNAFSAAGPSGPGELRAYNVAGDLWRVEGDVNGDGTADLVIDVHVLAGQPLTGGDFLV